MMERGGGGRGGCVCVSGWQLVGSSLVWQCTAIASLSTLKCSWLFGGCNGLRVSGTHL